MNSSALSQYEARIAALERKITESSVTTVSSAPFATIDKTLAIIDRLTQQHAPLAHTAHQQLVEPTQAAVDPPSSPLLPSAPPPAALNPANAMEVAPVENSSSELKSDKAPKRQIESKGATKHSATKTSVGGILSSNSLILI